MELLPAIKNGQTSYIFNVNLLDSTSNTGGGKTGLTNATSGLLISTIADNEAAATVYTGGSTIQTIAAIGTYAAPSASNCRFIQVDSTNHPGLYQIQLADARYAVANAKVLYFCISGASGLVPRHFAIPLVSDNPYVAKPSNSNLLSIDASGRVDLGNVLGAASQGTAGYVGVDWSKINAPSTVQNFSGTQIQSVIGAIGSVSSGVIVSTNNDKSGYQLSSSGSTILTESYATLGSAPTLNQILFEIRALLAENTVASTTVTTKKLDGSTVAHTYTINSATAPTSITTAS